MFLHMSVILSTGGSTWAGTPRAGTPQRQVPLWTVTPPLWAGIAPLGRLPSPHPKVGILLPGQEQVPPPIPLECIFVGIFFVSRNWMKMKTPIDWEGSMPILTYCVGPSRTGMNNLCIAGFIVLSLWMDISLCN